MMRIYSTTNLTIQNSTSFGLGVWFLTLQFNDLLLSLDHPVTGLVLLSLRIYDLDA